MATVKYETGCYHMIMNKSSICEDFFQLSTKLAGDIMQKFANYHVKMAIVGESLKDFIYETNNGKDIFLVANKKQAIKKLSIV